MTLTMVSYVNGVRQVKPFRFIPNREWQAYSATHMGRELWAEEGAACGGEVERVALRTVDVVGSELVC